MSGASSLYSSVDAGGMHDSTLEAQFRERLAAIDQVTAPLRPSSQRGDGSRASTPCRSDSPTLLSVGAAFILVFCERFIHGRRGHLAWARLPTPDPKTSLPGQI